MTIPSRAEDATSDLISGSNHPTPTTESDAPQLKSVPDEETKRRYLSLLNHDELIGLILLADHDRNAPLFPEDLPQAIGLLHSLRSVAYRGGFSHPPHGNDPSPNGATSAPDTHHPAEQHGSHPAPIPHYMFFPPPPPPPLSFPPSFPPAPPNPSVTKLATPQTIESPARPVPPRDDSFSSASQGPVIPPVVPPAPNTSWNNGMPSYEEMICMALADLASPDGSPPKALFEWMVSRFPVMNNFRPSAHQALQKAYKRGRLIKNGSKYLLNPAWGGGSTSRRTTRRPQAAGGVAPPVIPFPTPAPTWPAAGLAQASLPTSPPAPVETPAIASPQPPDTGNISHVDISPDVLPAAALLQAIAGINGIIGDDGSKQGAPQAIPAALSPEAPIDGEPAEYLDDEDSDDEDMESGEALQSSFATLAAQLRDAASMNATPAV